MPNRIVSLESEDRDFRQEGAVISHKPVRYLLAIPVVILIGILVASGVYYLLKAREEAREKSRFGEPLLEHESSHEKKIYPLELPDDGDLKRAVELYRRGYIRPAQALFQDIVESAKPNQVKAYALVYLGIIADEEGKFNLAADFLERAIRLDPENFHAHYNLAIVLRHKGLYREALERLAKAQSLRPDLVDAGILKGQLEYESQDYGSAERTLRKITEESGDPLAYYNLGMVYKKEGKFAEAKSAFLSALERAVAGELAYKAAAQLGIIHATQGDLSNARYYFERAIDLSPQNPKYYYNLALVLYRMGDVEGALKNLQKAVQLGSENPQVYSYIAQLFQELGKTAQAEEALRRALEQAPQDTVLLSEMADLQISQGKWSQAVSTLKRILELSTKTKEKATAFYNLGKVYRELKDYISAEEALSRAHDLDSLNEDILVELAQLYASKGEGHKAVALLKEALRINPDNTKLLRSQAELYLNLGLLTEAEESLRRLSGHPLAKEDDNYFAALELGEIYRRRRQYEDAIRQWERVQNATNEDMRYRALVSMAEAMLHTERPTSLILAKLQNAIALKANADDARLLLARALLREGSLQALERAEEELTALIRQQKSPPEWLSKAHTLRGIVFYKQGLLHRSLDDFNRALELDPSNQEAFQNKRALAMRLENQ
ncbi:MAG: tetratricopeptide repeat protein [Leptospiraceae bacterium]|nr:tetratricopeptide repeat protein [Leptospiraceae bacterium]MDW8306033.1 tetratricopeptide repeat protein [Leptospiraceae bacterium]